MSTSKPDVVCIVDDDEGMSSAIARLLRPIKVEVRVYASPNAFLQDPLRHTCKCLLLDVRMPEMSGLKLQSHLAQTGWTAPIIFITGYADITMAVEAMRFGAMDFIEKPFSDQKLLDLVQKALEQQEGIEQQHARDSEIQARLVLLSPREQEVLAMLIDGNNSKLIAVKLDISTRTVEDHRANILKKLQAPSVMSLLGVLLKIRHV